VRPRGNARKEDTITGSLVPPDPWLALRRHTPARIALGRAGAGLPTQEWLRFGAAHAMARDAVHQAVQWDTLAAALQADGWATLDAHSRAASRDEYLRRPDLGRRLREDSAQALSAAAASGAASTAGAGAGAIAAAGLDVALVLGDGLSAAAVQAHALPTLQALRDALQGTLRLSPVVLARQARVALADEVGELLQARVVLVLLGERPGLSAPDSLGAYLTFAPRTGRSDAERNCVSNIRPEGLAPAVAGARIAWLLREALRLQLSGVQLKDRSDEPLLAAAAPAAPPPPRR
jgi:ethanolamine ammonia-lyase small subunit